MKHIKQILAAVMAVAIVAAAAPFVFPATASANGVQKKLDELRAVYDTGTFFTVDGNACYSNQSDNCRLSLIPSRGGLPSGADVVAGSDAESWSCRAFANYVFYYLFGERYWHLQSAETPVLGDFIKLNGGRHSAIYLWEDANNYYVYDSNGDSQNGVVYNRAFSKSGWTISGVYHALSYDEVMRGGDSVVYHELTEGRYGVYNVLTGLYIGNAARTVSETDADAALYTLTKEHKDTAAALAELTEDGVTVSIACGENEKTAWLPEPVAGGYVIRSAEDPSMVLTAKDDTVVLAAYNGSAAQVWSFSAPTHRFTEEARSASTCAVHGEKLLRCADCGFTCVESQPLEAHIYTVEMIAPEENAYGFIKYKCVNCGNVIRKDVKEKLDPTAMVDTGEIVQQKDGFVYIASTVTEEALFDAFPGYIYESEASADGSDLRLVPAGAETVTEEQILTLVLPGDLDGDGKVTPVDARILLRACVGIDTLETDRETRAADLDFDGKISPQDARWALRTAVGYETGATTLAGFIAG